MQGLTHYQHLPQPKIDNLILKVIKSPHKKGNVRSIVKIIPPHIQKQLLIYGG
jgi:hypothetical protein